MPSPFPPIVAGSPNAQALVTSIWAEVVDVPNTYVPSVPELLVQFPSTSILTAVGLVKLSVQIAQAPFPILSPIAVKASPAAADALTVPTPSLAEPSPSTKVSAAEV